MGDGFKVELDRLGKLTQTLKTAEASMNNANDRLKNSSAKDLGSNSLDAAGESFQSTWEYGIGKIAEMSKGMADSLSAATKLYLDAERKAAKDIAEAAKSGGQGGQGQQGGGDPQSKISRTLNPEQA